MAAAERMQPHRLSWRNMRHKSDNDSIVARAATSSPQTVRSYISSASTGMTVSDIGSGAGVGIIGGGYGGGTLSGRTTATSGRMSTSGINTLTGSNNTLNELHGDYHSTDLTGVASVSAQPTKNSPHNNNNNNNNSNSFSVANGSTVKLLPAADKESNQQTKCSIFRGLVLCVCLNVSYANVVRFPREMDRYGLAYLIPYLALLLLVGLPLILLEISLGQFLGQGAAHTWRSSPIFKGACIVSRFASWLSSVWVSMQAVLALAYLGSFVIKASPLRECAKIQLHSQQGYNVMSVSGQECLRLTFLTPFWRNPLFFGLLSVGLICIWIVVMLCTLNGKILRRSLFVYGLMGFALLCCMTGWEIRNSISRDFFPELWPFEPELLAESHIWFNALVQVLFSVNCGFGALPVLTGKFLYKGDAVRTSIVYLCFNLLVNAIAVTLFMVQFYESESAGYMIDELKPLTAIYDRIFHEISSSGVSATFMPILFYGLIIVTAFVSTTVAIYTSTRLVPRRPNCVLCLIALVVSVISLSAPKFIIARVLDNRIVGTMAITALAFELVAITWIYGAKNVYTDLEFSIGRPISKAWMSLWCICPSILTGILVWWCVDDDQFDLMGAYLPRWAPIIFVLLVILIIACIQIFRQVEYNFFGMICEASKAAKEWGPADPLARHAWKQWRSVCQDTGRRDFTLRRRGTRDYTHSIKREQYSTSNKYITSNHAAPCVAHQSHWKFSTPDNSSPNYSGSVFGDSAIEEDISVDKFPNVLQQFVPIHANDANKPLCYSNRNQDCVQPQMLPQAHMQCRRETGEKHREVVYIRRMSDGGSGQHATRIQITPSVDIGIGHCKGKGRGSRNDMTKNPLGRSTGCLAAVDLTYPNVMNVTNIKRSASSVVSTTGNTHTNKLPPPTAAAAGDHICWRKFNVNPEEYSTEL